ncbi:hypothetical protein [Streptomyces iconiensis]|uniref:Uncharacterized protein n=1 Tax=Streptomyces iconiensis TaxID=1384038 RepID=A0ABT7A8T2_9ACTN|nr:hypothetical protein [Streptomyces iconiensis]MDJ1137730.1 hypothetical protein [Streptomyces iconiensis]
MKAPAHRTTGKSRTRTAAGSAQTRLPWWVVVLPALGFALFFALLLGGGQAHAAQQASENPLLAFLLHVRDALLG